MSKAETTRARAWAALSSLKLTIACLAMLMVLVVACTLAQVRLGTLGATQAYIHSFFVYWDVPGSEWSIPVFPGGALVGLILIFNLVAAQVTRLQLHWRKAGLWLLHLGLIVLFGGEFVSGMFQKEMQLPIEQGETRNYVESPRDVELAMVDTTAADHDDSYGIPESKLEAGETVAVPGTPISFKVHRYLRNAELLRAGPGAAPSGATAGIGPQVSLRELAAASNDDQVDQRAAVVEPIAGGKSYGKWLVSTALGAPQSFVHEGHTYALSMRFAREYLPYSLTLEKFSHDVYPGTDIPKNFSSLVHLSDAEERALPATGGARQRGASGGRDVLISMNQPLRHAGKAFYQASFGKGDTLSILQVVENPGWLLPYVSCALVGAGLLLHFALSLGRGIRRRAAAEV
jgi:hypothetical protein